MLMLPLLILFAHYDVTSSNYLQPVPKHDSSEPTEELFPPVDENENLEKSASIKNGLQESFDQTEENSSNNINGNHEKNNYGSVLSKGLEQFVEYSIRSSMLKQLQEGGKEVNNYGFGEDNDENESSEKLDKFLDNTMFKNLHQGESTLPQLPLQLEYRLDAPGQPFLGDNLQSGGVHRPKRKDGNSQETVNTEKKDKHDDRFVNLGKVIEDGLRRTFSKPIQQIMPFQLKYSAPPPDKPLVQSSIESDDLQENPYSMVDSLKRADDKDDSLATNAHQQEVVVPEIKKADSFGDGFKLESQDWLLKTITRAIEAVMTRSFFKHQQQINMDDGSAPLNFEPTSFEPIKSLKPSEKRARFKGKRLVESSLKSKRTPSNVAHQQEKGVTNSEAKNVGFEQKLDSENWLLKIVRRTIENDMKSFLKQQLKINGFKSIPSGPIESIQPNQRGQLFEMERLVNTMNDWSDVEKVNNGEASLSSGINIMAPFVAGRKEEKKNIPFQEVWSRLSKFKKLLVRLEEIQKKSENRLFPDKSFTKEISSVAPTFDKNKGSGSNSFQNFVSRLTEINKLLIRLEEIQKNAGSRLLSENPFTKETFIKATTSDENEGKKSNTFQNFLSEITNINELLILLEKEQKKVESRFLYNKSLTGEIEHTMTQTPTSVKNSNYLQNILSRITKINELVIRLEGIVQNVDSRFFSKKSSENAHQSVTSVASDKIDGKSDSFQNVVSRVIDINKHLIRLKQIQKNIETLIFPSKSSENEIERPLLSSVAPNTEPEPIPVKRLKNNNQDPMIVPDVLQLSVLFKPIVEALNFETPIEVKPKSNHSNDKGTKAKIVEVKLPNNNVKSDQKEVKPIHAVDERVKSVENVLSRSEAFIKYAREKELRKLRKSRDLKS